MNELEKLRGLLTRCDEYLAEKGVIRDAKLRREIRIALSQQDEQEAFTPEIYRANDANDGQYLGPVVLLIEHNRAIEQARATRPAQTEQQATVKDCLTVQPMAYAVFADNGNVACFSTQREHPSLVAFEADGHSVVALAPIAQTAPHESEHHAQLLGQALGECIAAAGIIRPDASLSGPELLMFADDLKCHLAEQTAPQPEQVKAFEALQQAVAYLARSPSEAIHSGSALHKLMVAALSAQGEPESDNRE